ncbi:MAG TPA: hypothetical protein VE032_09355 [Actinomycetota bacterium]|nr:hypothetical protein [Actinomycetota bacterium]
MTKASGGGKVQFGTPARGKEASARATSGRHCDHPGCSTVLSTYNSSPTCWLHTGPTLRQPLERP